MNVEYERGDSYMLKLLGKELPIHLLYCKGSLNVKM